jgi:hypothetical protein
MPRSYASDLLVDDIDLHGERVAGRPYRQGRRRSDLFMLVLAAGASAAVLFNALALQQGRPGTAARGGASAAPDIRQVNTPRPTSTSPAVTPAATPAASVAAPAAPLPLDAAPAPVATPVPPAKPATPRTAPAADPAAPMADKAAASPADLLPPGDVPVSPRVMDIQKALARLGYGPIRIDGIFGAATEEAIQRFERDRRLPVTGQMSDRVIRELNAVSGFTIR